MKKERRLRRTMYERYFRLIEKPFELVPSPHFVYLSGTHKRAMHYLTYGLREKVGFMVLTGEVGSGKTTLIKNFIKDLDRSVRLAKVFNTRLNSEQLIAMINEDFGLSGRGKDKVQLLAELYDFLIKEHEKNGFAVIIIDEAQNLSPELLEEVRMLSNLETGDSKLLQIILVGQPELAKILSLTELRQLRQRISMMCHLYPLTREETEQYILHRLTVAGNRQAVTFSREALDAVYQYANGTPRVVNILCNFLMITAFTEETREIGAGMVNDIIQDLREEPPQSSKSDDDTVRKRALLNALLPNEHQEKGTISFSREGSQALKNVHVLMKEVSLRVSALEKGYTQLYTDYLVPLSKKLDLLEQYQCKEKNELASLLSTLLAELRAQKASPAFPVPLNGPNQVRGKFFKRFFGADGKRPERPV